jgi:MOSC domain-containing protein
MGVMAIWRYPVKAMLGELLDRVGVAAGGLDGDRRWVVAEAAGGTRIANKRGPTDARLRACRARLDRGGELAVTLPDGHTTVTGVAAVAAALSDLLGRGVTLVEHPGGGDRFARTGGHHDFAPLHLLTTRTLAHMSAVAPESDWDARRFRPNLVLDDGAAPGELTERELLGAELRGSSGVRLRVGLPTPRCVVPTRAREELPADPRILKAIAGQSRWDLGPFGRPGCLGAYAEVARGGHLVVGERLTVEPRAEPTPERAVAAAVERVVADA